MKYLITLGLVLVSFLTHSQSNQYEQQLRSEITYIDWRQEYVSSNCNPSFYWMVTRSTDLNQYGQFVYKIYFYSNSRYCDGQWAATYLQGVYLYINGVPLNNTPYWIIFKEVYHHQNFGFWSTPNPMIQIVWSNVSVN